MLNFLKKVFGKKSTGRKHDKNQPTIHKPSMQSEPPANNNKPVTVMRYALKSSDQSRRSEITKQEMKLLDTLYSRVPTMSDTQFDFTFDPIGSLYIFPEYVLRQARSYWLDNRMNFNWEKKSRQTTIFRPFENRSPKNEVPFESSSNLTELSNSFNYYLLPKVAVTIALSKESSARFESNLQDSVIAVQSIFDQSLQVINRMYNLGLAEDEQQRQKWANDKVRLKKILKSHPEKLSQEEKAYAIASKRSLQKVELSAVKSRLQQLPGGTRESVRNLIKILSLKSPLKPYRNILTHVSSANSFVHHARLSRFSNVRITTLNSTGVPPSDVFYNSNNMVAEEITGITLSNKKIVHLLKKEVMLRRKLINAIDEIMSEHDFPHTSPWLIYGACNHCGYVCLVNSPFNDEVVDSPLIVSRDEILCPNCGLRTRHHILRVYKLTYDSESDARFSIFRQCMGTLLYRRTSLSYRMQPFNHVHRQIITVIYGAALTVPIE